MKFNTAYNRPKTEPAPTGEKFEDTYEMDIDENGHKTLKLSETKENVYEKIQESLEETKIENIIRRALGGDPTALAATQGEYFDATDAPTSLAEAQKMIIAATQEFFQLPLDIREKFEHSPEQYIHEYGTQGWANKIGLKTEAETKQKEVTNSEQS